MVRVLVTNGKGGCGKTTIAVNLACAFATGGLITALADADRQRLSLGWLAARSAGAAAIRGLDWRDGPGEQPKGLQRLVIDAPAGLRGARAEALFEVADVLVVPVLPSVFDEGGTARYLERLAEVKGVRKGRKPVAVVANRVRPRTRAAKALDAFLAGAGHTPAAHLADRALYADLARQGLGLFDLDTPRNRPVRAEWQPLLKAIEAAG